MALTIIKFCLFVPQFTYFLRCAQLWKFQSHLETVDQSISAVMSKVLNVRLTDRAWDQACLPVRYGGLGVRKASTLSLPAFLSSGHSCESLCERIIGTSGFTEVALLAEARSAWCTICPDVPTGPQCQRSWDKLGCKLAQQKLLDSSANATDRARLLAVFEKESGHWLNAYPSPCIGTVLDDRSLTVLVGLRVGAAVTHPHQCVCGEQVTELAHHGLKCQKSAGRVPRHASLNDVIRRALASANVPALLEPHGIVRTDGKRPDGVTLVPWKQGRSMVWDATCVDTLAPTYIEDTSRRAGAAADTAEGKKARKYQCLSGSYMFAPLGFETLGPWGPQAKLILGELMNRLVEVTGDKRAGSFLAQRISLAIQRGNAASLLGTMPQISGLHLD